MAKASDITAVAGIATLIFAIYIGDGFGHAEGQSRAWEDVSFESLSVCT